MLMGGVRFEILKNAGIDFYSGFRKKAQGGGANQNPQNARYRLL